MCAIATLGKLTRTKLNRITGVRMASLRDILKKVQSSHRHIRRRCWDTDVYAIPVIQLDRGGLELFLCRPDTQMREYVMCPEDVPANDWVECD